MALVIYCTCPDTSVASEIAEALLEQRLAACVNLLPNVQSIYRWQGRIERDDEVLLLIKSDATRFEQLKKQILDLHPYELPEIIGVPVEAGYREYLRWITQSLSDS